MKYYENIVSFIDSIPNKEPYKNCRILKFKISFRNIYNCDTNIYYFYSDSIFSKSVDSLFRKTKLGDEYIISPTLISKSGNTFLTPNYSIIYNDEQYYWKNKLNKKPCQAFEFETFEDTIHCIAKEISSNNDTIEHSYIKFNKNGQILEEIYLNSSYSFPLEKYFYLNGKLIREHIINKHSKDSIVREYKYIQNELEKYLEYEFNFVEPGASIISTSPHYKTIEKSFWQLNNVNKYLNKFDTLNRIISNYDFQRRETRFYNYNKNGRIDTILVYNPDHLSSIILRNHKKDTIISQQYFYKCGNNEPEIFKTETIYFANSKNIKSIKKWWNNELEYLEEYKYLKDNFISEKRVKGIGYGDYKLIYQYLKE